MIIGFSGLILVPRLFITFLLCDYNTLLYYYYYYYYYYYHHHHQQQQQHHHHHQQQHHHHQDKMMSQFLECERSSRNVELKAVACACECNDTKVWNLAEEKFAEIRGNFVYKYCCVSCWRNWSAIFIFFLHVWGTAFVCWSINFARQTQSYFEFRHITLEKFTFVASTSDLETVVWAIYCKLIYYTP